MNKNKKTSIIIAVALVASLGIGIAVGSTLKGKGFNLVGGGDHNNNAIPVPVVDGNLANKSVEELSEQLSLVMLPEEEFLKLEAAIYQTGMGLLMAQAQGAGVPVSEENQAEFKKNIGEKYSRKYFSDMNATSMKELTKADLVSILSYYNTESGQKFLKLSPKIIQATMQAVQADLSSWLPKTVDAFVAKIKDGGEVKEEAQEKAEDKALEKKEEDNVPKEEKAS